jgi:hypothetical protein
MHKDKLILDKFYQSYDLFDSEIIKKLLISCDEHFFLNLHRSFTPEFKVTECIMDCHGLHLTDSTMYPYYQRHWNVFCKRICEEVRKYIFLVYPELTKQKWYYRSILSTGYQVFPHSCWAIKILPSFKNKVHLRKHYDSLWPKDTFITAIYYLENSSDHGTILRCEDSTYYRSDGVENSLLISRDCEFAECLPVNNESKTVILFDFCILGTNHNVPFASPRVVGP